MNKISNHPFHIIVIVLAISISQLYAQKSTELQKHYDLEFQTFKEFVIKNATFKGDENIDVKFYHLDIEIGIASPFIEGTVLCSFEPLVANLNEVILNLNSALSVQNVGFPGVAFIQENDEIIITLNEEYNPGDLINLEIEYEGVPVLAGGYKGLRYETHAGSEPIIATLSTPYLAHYWYPCKDGPEDKPDSVYVDITIPEMTYSGVELMAVSNGVLENVIDNGDTKTFQWRHRYPIVTYYVMAAISNYVQFQQIYNGAGGETFPLDYYVFQESLNTSQQGVVEMPDAMQFFSDVFGTYPFSNEKYGMTQLGFYGAIENQTNTITNNMSPSWFYISVHELGHMWFGDNITCSDWHHAWLNEGFATYSESLWEEHKYGFNAYKSYIQNEEYWNGGTLYLENAQDTFNIFQSIIYSKGAFTLHMLRGVLGDEIFFDGLLDYAQHPNLVYANATTGDLQEVYEAASGMDLEFFFDQWIYDEYYPAYEYNYVQNDDHSINFTIKQTQGDNGRRPVFEMPIKIKFNYPGGDTTITLWNDEQTQYYYLEFPQEITSVAFDPDKWILRTASYDPGLPVAIQNKYDDKLISIFPNPSNGVFMIHVNSGNEAEIKIRNINGKLIQTINPSKENQQIDLSHMLDGVYFICLEIDKKVQIEKIVISK
jgi:aminopeptidase N